MQNKARSKTKAEKTLVYKPYLKGNWHSGLAAKRGLKLLTYQLVFAFIYLFIGQALLFDALVLRILINLMVVLGFAALLYSDGAKTGLDDVAFAEIALQRQEAGKAIDQADKDRCFHPLKGFFTAFVGTLPLVLLALAFAFMTSLQVHQLGALPGWVQAYERRADVGLALQYYHVSAPFSLVDALRIIVRLSIFPYINMAGAGSNHTLLLMERLSPLLVLIIPMGYGLGYLQGRRLRAGVHGAISTDSKRRVQKERRERKRRQRQEPTKLV